MTTINALAWSILALVAASFYLFYLGPVWAVYTGVSTFALAALLLVLVVYLAELAVSGTGVERRVHNARSSYSKPIRRSVLAHNLRTWGALAWERQRSKRPLLCRLSVHRPTVGVEERVGVRLDSGVGLYDTQKGRRLCRRCGYQFRGAGPQNGGTE